MEGLARTGLASALLMLAACTENRSTSSAPTVGDCIEQAQVEFGELPLGAKVDLARLATSGRGVNTCLEPDGVSSCGFSGRDGVAYSFMGGHVGNKRLDLDGRAKTRAPLGVTRATRIGEARVAFQKAGAAAPSYVERDGTRVLSAALCPAYESASWFEVHFDPAGRAQAVELGSQP